jgi:tetratricopeptide (TPR) repeat protein
MVILVLLRLIPMLFPDVRAWGFNHLIFLPESFSVGFFLLAAAALIMPFVGVSEKLGSALLNWFSDRFYESRQKYLHRLAIMLLFTAAFITFVVPTHFFGDGYILLGNLGSASTILYKWTEIGALHFLVLIRSLLGPPGQWTALLTFQIISVLSGAITIWFLFLISQVASEDRTKRLLIFIGSLSSGILLLFFGYVEYYPMLWVFLTAYIYFSLRYLKGIGSLAPAFIFLMIGIGLHLMMAFFLPSLVYMWLSTGQAGRFYRQHRAFVWAALLIVSSGAVWAFYSAYTSNIYVRNIPLWFFEGKPTDPIYAVFSLSHFIDIFNEIILISPILFLLMLVPLRTVSRVFDNRTTAFLFILAVTSLLFLLIIDPILTMPRDWDLFSFSGLALAVLLILLLDRYGMKSLDRLLFSLLIILIIMPLPFLITNLGRDTSVKYAEYMASIDSPKTHHTFVLLHDYYQSRGDFARADSISRVYNNRFPHIRRYKIARRALENGDLRNATMIIQTLPRNQFDGDYQRILSRYYFVQGDYDRALNHINLAIALRPSASEYYGERAGIYFSKDQNDRAFDELRRGYKLGPRNPFILQIMTSAYPHFGLYDSSIYYGEQLLAMNETSPETYYYLALSYARRDNLDQARRYMDKLLEYVKDDSTLLPDYRKLDSLIKKNQENTPPRQISAIK